jgi:hypothetical protein
VTNLPFLLIVFFVIIVSSSSSSSSSSSVNKSGFIRGMHKCGLLGQKKANIFRI